MDRSYDYYCRFTILRLKIDGMLHFLRRRFQCRQKRYRISLLIVSVVVGIVLVFSLEHSSKIIFHSSKP